VKRRGLISWQHEGGQVEAHVREFDKPHDRRLIQHAIDEVKDSMFSVEEIFHGVTFAEMFAKALANYCGCGEEDEDRLWATLDDLMGVYSPQRPGDRNWVIADNRFGVSVCWLSDEQMNRLTRTNSEATDVLREEELSDFKAVLEESFRMHVSARKSLSDQIGPCRALERALHTEWVLESFIRNFDEYYPRMRAQVLEP